jgi:hypothetical protein
VNGSRIIFFQELTYVLNSKLRSTSVLEGDECTFQQQKNDSKKILKPAKEEWDQSNLQLANYAQNSYRMLS